MTQILLDVIVSSTIETKSMPEVEGVVLPGVSGELEVLPGHALSYILLSEGEITIIGKSGTQKIQINGGLCRVKENEVLILV